MTIHKEGRTILFILLILLFGINLLIYWLAPGNALLQNGIIAVSIVLYLLILQFFRSPKIKPIINDKHIIAPADGKVVVIENTTEAEYFNDRRKQISIFMSPVNVHVNRSPVAGVVKFFKYHAGKYLVAWHPKSSTENERTTLVVETNDGLEVMLRQIAGAVARRIKCYVKEGDRLAQGGEFGFIKFGSRVDVFLPIDAEIKVKVNDKTTAGKTVIAVLKSV
ncbi:MAG: phosphatidylserine decarboxylase family protein [Cytophagales bacterium]|nr:phosphatidylserine decarboxylase family protein [Cytophagales bacterium]